MARRFSRYESRKGYNRNYKQAGRENKILFANRRLPLSEVSIKDFLYGRDSLGEIEDRRRFHPEGVVRAARRVDSGRARFRIVGSTDFAAPEARSVPFGIGFREPKRVLVCIRRKIRREVLHAFRVAGRRGLNGPRYSEFSKVRC